jgi:ubiquinone biosynthesis protein UbiJ
MIKKDKKARRISAVELEIAVYRSAIARLTKRLDKLNNVKP